MSVSASGRIRAGSLSVRVRDECAGPLNRSAAIASPNAFSGKVESGLPEKMRYSNNSRVF
jgi:hypothetical protein